VSVVFFLLGESPAAEFYVPTFQNTLFQLHRSCERLMNMDSVPKRRHINSDIGESPKGKKYNCLMFVFLVCIHKDSLLVFST